MAIVFSGSGQYARYSNNLGWNDGQSFTIMAWVDNDNSSDWWQTWAYVARFSTFAQWSFSGRVKTQDSFKPSIVSGSSADGTSNCSTWKHVALVYDGAADSASIYVDGNATAEATATSVGGGVFGTSMNRLVVGGSMNGGDDTTIEYLFNGKIAAMKIWSAKLSPSDIASDYPYRNPQTNTGSVRATYKFANGALATDSSANGLTLTLTGSPTFTSDPTGILGDDPSGYNPPLLPGGFNLDGMGGAGRHRKNRVS